MSRQRVSSGTHWESAYGYSRAVRVGDMVFVAGTTAVDADGEVVGPGDPYRQASFIYAKIGDALAQAGASLEDVVRARTFVTDIERWTDVARAQGEVFADIRPVATLVQVSALVDPRLLVEIEVDAVIAPGAQEPAV